MGKNKKKESSEKEVVSEDLVKIGQKLRQIRTERGYSSYESFAWDNDIPRMQYWRMEKGKNFTFTSLIKILDKLDISLKEFFEDFE